jgi:hypothetical protein
VSRPHKQRSTRFCPSSDHQVSFRVPQKSSRISDTRKGPPAFINFEEHLNATNGEFTIPALNFSLNPPASILLDRPASGTPVPSAQTQFAVESVLSRQPPSNIPSPTPTLVGEPDIPTGSRGVHNASRDIPLAPRSAPGNTRIPQFPIDVRPHKPLPSSRKSKQCNDIHSVSVGMNPTAQSCRTDTSFQTMAPPVLPSRSDKATRTFGESEIDPRPAKRFKTRQTTQTRNGVSRVIRHIEHRYHLQSS